MWALARSAKAESTPSAESKRNWVQTRGVDVFERYELARALRDQPSIASVRSLVELLVDDGRCVLHEAPAPYDVETTYGHVAEEARGSLVAMLPVALPWIVEVLPAASVEQTRELLGVIDSANIAHRIALPDDAHATIVAAAERVDEEGASAARFERDVARQVRAGELADPERFWRRWLAHPTRAFAALYELEKLVPDKAAFALELARATDDPRLRSTAAYLLARLPPLLPPDVVQRLAASTLPREHDILVPMLARHGAPAAALMPLCLEMLENEPLADDESWNSRHLRWDRATTALVALIDVVDPVVLEPLLAAMQADTHRYRACGDSIRAALAARSIPERDDCEPADVPGLPY